MTMLFEKNVDSWTRRVLVSVVFALKLGLSSDSHSPLSSEESPTIETVSKRVDQLTGDILATWGRNYEKGKTVSKDYLQAFDYYKQAVALEHPEGYAGCGVLATKIMLSERNLFSKTALDAAHHAFVNLSAAARLGSKRGLFNLAQFYDLGAPMYVLTGSSYTLCLYINKKWAADLYERARHQGSKKATAHLADFYEKGIGVPKNIDVAKKLYAELGCIPPSLVVPAPFKWDPIEDRGSFFAGDLFSALYITPPSDHQAADDQ